MALQEEHQEIQANRKDGTNLTWLEVNNMPYTARVSSNLLVMCLNTTNPFVGSSLLLILSHTEIQVISENLRRATILPWYSRKAAQDFEIDGISTTVSNEQQFHIFPAEMTLVQDC